MILIYVWIRSRLLFIHISVQINLWHTSFRLTSFQKSHVQQFSYQFHLISPTTPAPSRASLGNPNVCGAWSKVTAWHGATSMSFCGEPFTKLFTSQELWIDVVMFRSWRTVERRNWNGCFFFPKKQRGCKVPLRVVRLSLWSCFRGLNYGKSFTWSLIVVVLGPNIPETSFWFKCTI